MTLLGVWQLQRYEHRSEINQRIDAAEAGEAAPLTSLLPAPEPANQVGPPPPADAGWAMVTATGQYDPAQEVLVRSRTVEGRVGVEVVTPLRLSDGTAVLIDRGWVPPAETGAADRPDAPAPPAGEVTVTGWVRPSERPDQVERRDGDLHTRRIDAATLAEHLPYPVYDGYLLLADQDPPVDEAFTLVPPRRENSWLNAGYAGQWWIFAGLVLFGYGWVARREAHRDHSGHTSGAGSSTASATVTA
ncbi:SURF1 family protein [Natronosporangium hydrolyticum]|uniref:SURF1-like protein n=2 Tax=Natronosporangium hydrolyticum TaxID=2811111 RepID=A0A895YNA7_9ACTN|nr:SURF1 family protein [Natronosporangium hydrolyticum]